MKSPDLMNYSKRILFLLFPILVFSSCDKDPKQTGCTDQYAVNYDPSALEEDGSCTYNDAEQIIWVDGIPGGWNGDLQQGAFRMNVCVGEAKTLSVELDSATVEESLYLGTADGLEHQSYFTIINKQNALVFSEGSLRMGMRILDAEVGTPELIRFYLDGKILQTQYCEPHRRSDFVEISTHSFNDSIFTPVNIPIGDFHQKIMANVTVVCGIQFDGGSSSGIEIDQISWVANKLD